MEWEWDNRWQASNSTVPIRSLQTILRMFVMKVAVVFESIFLYNYDGYFSPSSSFNPPLFFLSTGSYNLKKSNTLIPIVGISTHYLYTLGSHHTAVILPLFPKDQEDAKVRLGDCLPAPPISEEDMYWPFGSSLDPLLRLHPMMSRIGSRFIGYS